MIGNIEENKSLILHNVLCFRRKLDQQASMNISKEIDGLLEKNNAKKNGSTVTITHNVTVENGKQVIDFEMLIPLDKEVSVSDGFSFMSEFVLNNAFKVRIEGNPQQMQGAVQVLAEYIKSKNLKPNTPLYVVTVKEAKTPMNLDDMVTDLYIGVKKI